jgi:hypothetical protein
MLIATLKVGENDQSVRRTNEEEKEMSERLAKLLESIYLQVIKKNQI